MKNKKNESVESMEARLEEERIMNLTVEEFIAELLAL
jgi:hypothetical protein